MKMEETDLLKLVSEKGRSASFCVPAAQLQLQSNAKDQDSATLSTQELSSPDKEVQKMSAAATRVLLHESLHASESCEASVNNISSPSLNVTHEARRSQSCRIPSSRNSSRPKVRRRLAAEEQKSGPGSGSNSSNRLAPENQHQQQAPESETESYNPFLKKVPSCGRLVSLDPEDYFAMQEQASAQESPSPLRRSVSARRPAGRSLMSDPLTDHSPTPPRHPRHSSSRNKSTRSSTRRASTKRSTNCALLDIKDNSQETSTVETLDSEQYLLRNFQTTNKGFINRGDSFRRRKSRSNSIAPPDDSSPCSSHTASTNAVSEAAAVGPKPPDEAEDEAGAPYQTGSYRVPVIGTSGVGKSALIVQFQTSLSSNTFDGPTIVSDDDTESPEVVIPVNLNGYLSEMKFVISTSVEEYMEEYPSEADGWVMVYSITDRSSFQKVSDDVSKLQKLSLLKGKALVLVGNKCDLVRSRVVSTDEARDLAMKHNAKFMEVSSGMNHKCDELFVGIVCQTRLRDESNAADSDKQASDKEKQADKNPFKRNRSLLRASQKAKRLIHRVMGKSDNSNAGMPTPTSRVRRVSGI